jgi:hypothetical protein
MLDQNTKKEINVNGRLFGWGTCRRWEEEDRGQGGQNVIEVHCTHVGKVHNESH